MPITAWKRMLLSAAVGVSALFLLGADGPEKVTEAQARQQLTGVWRGFTVEGKGERPDRGPVKLELTVTDRTMHGIQIKDGDRLDHGEGQYVLDLTSDLRQLDATQSNDRGRKKEYVGIYTVDGDTLKWCVSPQKVRPTTFETRKGQFLLILKRDPAGAAKP